MSDRRFQATFLLLFQGLFVCHRALYTAGFAEVSFHTVCVPTKRVLLDPKMCLYWIAAPASPYAVLGLWSPLRPESHHQPPSRVLNDAANSAYNRCFGDCFNCRTGGRQRSSSSTQP